ncbi:SUMF1/EgtB/PvdO family nonheme iron enzyme [Pelomyxa schiedti]|nr:SUMF1/EgtB/PvdO family nonheme iron enzyme [Pelomyxa schiedti]
MARVAIGAMAVVIMGCGVMVCGTPTCSSGMMGFSATLGGVAREWCMDVYEAPNIEGAFPLVMYTYNMSRDWCQEAGKRLCYDDEFNYVCGGPDGMPYPYGSVWVPGMCNDNKVWRTYNQTKLNWWPRSCSSTTQQTYDTLQDCVHGLGDWMCDTSGDHEHWLYQATPSGAKPDCTYKDFGVYDLFGNMEEWTIRRDGGTTDFHGNLKGRYWAEARTCQSSVTTHGDDFMFYEIGFRCCSDGL